MKSILRRALSHVPVRLVHRHPRRAKRKQIRVGAVLVIVCLLLASLPASSGTTHGLARQSNGPVLGRLSFPSRIYHGVTTKLASLGSWMTSYLKSESHPSGDNTYQPVVAYFNSPPPFIDAPTNLNVTGVQAGRISLSWIGPASGGVDHYQIERSTNISGSFTFLTNVSGAVTFYNDDTVSNQHSYLYRVRSVTSGGAVSAPSNMAMGTAIAFEFANLQGQEIRKQHFYDVRTAVNAVRTAANLSLASWAPRDDLTGLEVKTDDVQQIRTALDAALQALGIPVTAYEDSTLTSDTLIRAIHLEQLQTRSTRGSSNGSGSLESDSSTARLDPMNETGGGGENPLSRNFNWNLPLLNLPGRAGMDLSLTLSYNSLVWNKIGTGAIAFDEDNGFPGPGFRLGFPVIQPLYANSQTGKDAFLLIGPDGSRTELRQVGSLPLYESADSSHLLLDATTMILRSTDGTQLSYALQGAEYKCAQIKDRNGNYITATYTVAGQINTITDTLGRAITFNYANGWLTDITQVWNPSPASPHYWARFEYEDKLIDTNFPGKTVYGPADQTYIKTLTKVKLADDSYFKFDYTSWGQAFKVSAYAPNNDLLNYRKYNLPETGSLAHDDCPRFTERRDWAKYWNGDTEGTSAESEEALTQFAIPADTSWTMPGESSPVSGMRAQVTAPDGTSNKIYFLGEFGWQRDLPALVDTYASGVTNPVRRAKTTWTQDDPTVSYPLNPRVTETNIYDDASNRARTVITYQQFEFSNETSCHLPEVVKEYAADASTILRSTKTLYKMDEDYTDERILGLVSDKYVYDGDVSGTLAARVGYFYDQSGSLSGNDAPVQHDHTNLDGNTNYNSSFLIRGNLSSVKRYDITDTNFLTTTTTSTSYNTAGAVVSATDAASHTVTISYGDSFSDGVSRNTLAYATTTTDAAGYFSKFKYNFAFGALTYRQTPPPNYTGAPSLQPAGPEQTFEYYEDGRLKKQLNEENDAYTRYIYGPNYVESWGTVNTSADEAHSLQIFDGAGRVIATAMNHPGSTGGFSGIITTYDAMGRPVQRSNPAETSISIPEPAASINPFAWQPTGDDAQWVYTMQTYDWKGRPRVTTNPSMTGNPADTTSKETSYSGCGCAGGEVVTLTDEVGRRLKVFSDVLGREWKKEILNWDGSVYSTSVSVFNGRDQVTNVKRYAGTAPVDASSTNAEASCPSGTCQETLLTYDGYGRLQSKHVPQQNAGTTTTYSYNSDDTLNTTTDARGALTTYVYNSRHMTTSVVSTLSGSPTIAVTHGYDAAGNRTSMSQTSGGVAHDNTTYSYDQLSRMTSETIHIDQIENYSPNYGSYTIGYEYNLSNQLTSVVDPFSTATSITYDQVGRTATVTGSWNGTNYTYANNVTYRAWGGLKSATVGGANKAITYNNRMLPSHFGGAGMSIDYTYHNDGKLNTFKDLADQIGDPHDVQFHYMSRAYSYDHAGRISGVGQLPNYSVLPPFSGSYGYDAFDNLTSRTGSYALNPSQTDTASYTNNRRGGWSYNAEGQITSSSDTSDSGGSSTRSWTYDAAGRSIFVSELRNGQTTTTAMGYDGDGELITELVNGSTADYFVRSSVLGTVLTKLKLTGGKDVTYVPANGLVYPMQMQDQAFSTPSSYMRWVHHDPSGVQESNNGFLSAYDPFGGLISNVQPPVGGPPPYTPFYGATYGGVTWNSFINANNFSAGCLLDGRPTDCNRVQFALQNNPFVQLDPNHSLPWTASGANQTSQLPFGIREEWRLVQPGQRAPQGAKTRSGYFGEFILYAHYSFFGGGNLFPDPQNPYDPRADFRDYAVSLANNTSITDCNKLALLIYKAGQAFGGNKPAENGGRAIVDGLMAGLTEYTRVTLGGRQGPSDPNFRVGVFGRDRYFAGGFHDSGFDVRFRDAGGNQVRHFIFYFGAGFGIGEWAANHGLYDAEGTKSGRNPDVALGWEGTKRGARFDGNYKALAQDVWRHVCGQSTTLNLP